MDIIIKDPASTEKQELTKKKNILADFAASKYGKTDVYLCSNVWVPVIIQKKWIFIFFCGHTGIVCWMNFIKKKYDNCELISQKIPSNFIYGKSFKSSLSVT